jgi:uncharacterized protein (DUF1800 family)
MTANRCLAQFAFYCFVPALAHAAVTVAVSPTTAAVRLTGGQRFTSTITGSSNTSATWTVNGVVGGNATVGTISSFGQYTAPAVMPTGAITIKVTSVADSTKSATATVTLQNPVPALYGLTPYGANFDTPFVIVATGDKFVPASKIVMNGTALATTFVSAKELRASARTTLPVDTLLQIRVSSPDPGASESSVKTIKVIPMISLSISPSRRDVRIGTTQQFTSYVGNTSDKVVNWFVNDVAGGNATVGTITPDGLYTPPAVLPANNAITVKGVAKAEARAVASSAVTLLNPLPVLTSAPSSLTPGTVQFTVQGSGFVNGSKVFLGGKELATTFTNSTTLSAQGTLPAIPGSVAGIKVTNPAPGPAESASLVVRLPKPANLAELHRFLEQATWGPTPESVARLQQLGKERFLDEQFSLPPSPYPDPVPDMSSMTPVQRRFFTNAMNAPDQLRQRMAFALSQIFVVSAVKTGSDFQMIPYIRMLQDKAFGNYLDLMKAVTLSPTMGRFLDMVNNDKPDLVKKTSANENYARELLQLFTIGMVELNPDGTPKAFGLAGTYPSYDEEDVKNFARAFTGWTFPTKPGATPQKYNPSFYEGPMVAWDANHDKDPKTLLNGVVIPGGRTAQEDLDAALKNIFEHRNVGPFVAQRLIRHFVTSNPSRPYVQRVAAVFDNNGQGVRGDLRAVLRAILLDPEASAPAVPAQAGHLREPVLYAIASLRALKANVAEDNGLAGYGDGMGQRVFFSPSVFNYFSPLYKIPGGLSAPEFQITTPSTSLTRANFANRIARNGFGASVTVDYAALESIATNVDALSEALGNALLGGPLPQPLKDAINTACAATTDVKTRVRNSVFLVLSSSFYQVQR